MITGTLQPPTRNEQIDVGTTSTIIMGQRQEGATNLRHSYIIRNMSASEDDIITINIGYGLAVATKGIVLKKGESVSESVTSQINDVWQGTISAICETANGVLSIFER